MALKLNSNFRRHFLWNKLTKVSFSKYNFINKRLRNYMKSILQTTLVIVCLYNLYSCQEKQLEVNKFIIKGTTINTDTDTLHLFNPEQDFAFDKGIQIPVTNHHFEYELPINHSQGFFLMLNETIDNGGGRYFNVFVEPGITELTIYDEESFDSNIVKGSELNMAYTAYSKKLKGPF